MLLKARRERWNELISTINLLNVLTARLAKVEGNKNSQISAHFMIIVRMFSFQEKLRNCSMRKFSNSRAFYIPTNSILSTWNVFVKYLKKIFTSLLIPPEAVALEIDMKGFEG